MKNPYTNLYYIQKDFVVGNTIYFNKYIFRLLECTKKYMIDNPEFFRDSDLDYVVSRLRSGASGYLKLEDYVVEVLKQLDPENEGLISKEVILAGFKK